MSIDATVAIVLQNLSFLQYRMPQVEFASCEIEKENFRDSQGKRIRTENNDSFESKSMKQMQQCVTVSG